MKFRKTPLKQRSTYIYYDAEGNIVAELVPGADGVTELDIKMLHQADDREVYNNLKNSKPKLSDDEKQGIKEWEQRTGHEWTEKNYNLSFDAVAEDGEGNDKSKLWYQVFNIKQETEEVDPEVERMREVIMQLTPAQQDLYRLVYLEEKPQVEVAAMLGIKKQALYSKLKKIHRRIEKLF